MRNIHVGLMFRIIYYFGSKYFVLGIDASTSYLMPHARKRNVKGNRSLRQYLDFPKKNICSKLAIEVSQIFHK